MRKPTRLPLEALAPYLLEPPAEPTPLAWPAVFGNDRPVEIEVGFGKGLFLVTAGQACPHVNFLGIEIVRKYQLYAATRVAKRQLPNVRLAKADARLFLRDYVAAASVQAVHAYFPDPWWKKRHWKRRLFTPEFVRECERVLRPGGKMYVMTDVEEYFGVITSLMAEQTRLVALPPPERPPPEHDLDYRTNFERKFRKAGKPIYASVYERPAT